MSTIIFLMAGNDAPFKEAGYTFPKNLVEIDGAPLVKRVLDGVASIRTDLVNVVCVVPKSENRRQHTGRMIQLIVPSAHIVETNSPTGGAACSALLAIQYIARNEPLIIANGDIVIHHPLADVLADFTARGLDAGVIAFRDVHPRWSFVKLGGDGLACELAEKRPISDMATTGFFWFSKGGDFVDAAEKMLLKDGHVDGVFFLAPVLNELILRNQKVGVHIVPKASYFSLKTPQDVRVYEDALVATRRTSK